MKTSEHTNEIAKAMSKAQKQMRPAIKDASNPHFRSKFSSITAVWECLREPMTDNLLSVVQDVTTESGFVSIETRILHESDQWISFGPLKLPVTKQDAQGYGSAISYARRYALCSALGIVSDDDDDGNAASAPPKYMPKITKQQADELIEMFSKCSENFQTFVMNKIKSDPINASNLYQLPVNCYDALRLSIEENMNK